MVWCRARHGFTVFLMNKPNSEIILGYSKEESKIHLIWGKIKTNVNRALFGDGTMEVEMSEGVAGIKGTILVTEETGTESTLKVLRGHVNFTSKSTGKSEMVGPGEMITATKKGLGEKKKFDIAKENATWESNEAMIKDVKSKSNGFPFLLVIIILAIIMGGYFYFIKQKNPIKSPKLIKIMSANSFFWKKSMNFFNKKIWTPLRSSDIFTRLRRLR